MRSKILFNHNIYTVYETRTKHLTQIPPTTLTTWDCELAQSMFILKLHFIVAESTSLFSSELKLKWKISFLVLSCNLQMCSFAPGSKISKDCEVEMVEHRQILMEDYRLSPEIVTLCSNDISKFCKGLEIGGKTIHCLMEHTRPKKRRDRVSQLCQRSVNVPG